MLTRRPSCLAALLVLLVGVYTAPTSASNPQIRAGNGARPHASLAGGARARPRREQSREGRAVSGASLPMLASASRCAGSPSAPGRDLAVGRRRTGGALTPQGVRGAHPPPARR